MVLYNTRFSDRGLPELVKEQTLKTSMKKITCADHIYQVCTETLKMQLYTEEYIYIIGVNNYGELLGCMEISHGTVNATLATPREIFMKLLLLGAASFFLIHNHPSQHVEPSKEDILLTERIKRSGKLLGIPLLEHIIVGRESYTALLRDKYVL